MTIETTVWRLIGLTGSKRGVLTLGNGRLAFNGDEGTKFNVPLGAVSGIKFPWYYFHGGVKMTIANESYRFSFIEPHNEHANIREGRRTGARWKAALDRPN